MSIAETFCLLLCAVAAVIDLRTQRIPNWLTYPAALVATALALTAHGPGPAAAAGGVALLFGSFLVLNLLGAVGMGDAKLLGVVGALLGWPSAYAVLVDVLIAGSLLALLIAVATRKLGRVLSNLPAALRSRDAIGSANRHPMPYASAILLGTAYAIASGPLGLPNVP